MKVLHIVHSLRRGGAERIILELSLGLEGLGHEVRVLGLVEVNEYGERPYNRVPCDFLVKPADYCWPWGIPRLAKKMRSAVDRFNPDVLQIHTANAAIVAACGLLKQPAIQVFHGYGGLDPPPSFKSRVRRHLEQWSFRQLACRGVVVSHPMKAAVAAHLGCKEDKLQCIMNGIDLKRFSFIKREPTNRPVICSVGTLAEHKRPDEAIRAFAIFRQRLPGAKLRMVGDGPLRPRLEQLIQGLNLSGAVELLGRREDIPDLLASCHLFWHLSQSEGLPLVIAEAMATGLPVVGTDVRGISEVVVDGVTGFRVPSGNAAVVKEKSYQLLSDQNLFMSFSNKGRKVVETYFNKEIMVKLHADLLLEVAEKKNL